MTNRDKAKEVAVEKLQKAIEAARPVGKLILIRELKAELQTLGFLKDPLKARLELLEHVINTQMDTEHRVLKRDARLVLENPNKDIDEMLRETINDLEALLPN